MSESIKVIKKETVQRLLKDLKQIIKHPLTDIGLAQFLADHRKANS